MKTRSPRWLWAGLGVVVLLGLVWHFSPAGAPAGRLQPIPAQGFGFASRDVPLNQVETQVFRHADALKRIYQTRSARFLLTAIDGTRDRHAVHDPLYCFRGDGWQVVRQQTIAVPNGRARLLTLARAGRQTEVVFWFTNGRERQDSAWRAWWQSLCRRATFGRSGLEPALILLQPASGEVPAWTQIFTQCPFLFEI